MSGTVKRLSSLLMAFTVGLLAGTGAFADDTEIYVGLNQGQSVAKPNVLFILDTSGSMGTEVTTTRPRRMPATALPTRSSGRPPDVRLTATTTTGLTRPSSGVKRPQAHWALLAPTPTGSRAGNRTPERAGASGNVSIPTSKTRRTSNARGPVPMARVNCRKTTVWMSSRSSCTRRTFDQTSTASRTPSVIHDRLHPRFPAA
jgi:hypothetical protein